MVVFEIDIPQVIAFAAGAVAAYAIVKRRLKQIRLFIDALDDSLVDDKVSDAEFKNLWDLSKKVIRKEE